MPFIKNFRSPLSEDEVLDMIKRTNILFSQSKILEVQSFIAFQFLSGVRVSEHLMLKRENFWTTDFFLNVRVPVLKIGKRKNEAIEFPRILYFPLDSEKIDVYLDLIIKQVSRTNAGLRVWRFDRRRGWEIFQRFGLKVYPHLFRHSLATVFAEKNISAEKASVWFGWKKASTFDTYRHRTKKTMIELADVFR